VYKALIRHTITQTDLDTLSKEVLDRWRAVYKQPTANIFMTHLLDLIVSHFYKYPFSLVYLPERNEFMARLGEWRADRSESILAVWEVVKAAMEYEVGKTPRDPNARWLVETIGERIKHRRLAAKLSVKAAADRSSFSTTTWDAIENNKRAPSDTFVAEAAEAVGVDPSILQDPTPYYVNWEEIKHAGYRNPWTDRKR
jgi:hypothetical protein